MIFGTLQLLQPLLGRLMYLLSSMVEVDPSMSFFGTHDVSVVSVNLTEAWGQFVPFIWLVWCGSQH